jgi:multidrug resistance efflux pump
MTKNTMVTNRANNRFGTVAPAKKRTASIHLVQSSRFAQRLAKLLLIGLALSIVAMAFLPWQQTSRGNGQVVAYAPQERQQTIQARNKGVVGRIADGLVEGTVLRKGDFILEIQPFAANMVDNLKGQLTELRTKEGTAKVKAEAYQQNVQGFSEALDFAMSAAAEMVSAAEAKLESKQRQIPAYEAKELQARLNFERQQSLFERGIKPAKEIEKLTKELDVTKADLDSVKEDVSGLKNELKAKQEELEEKRRVAQTKIDYARAMEQDALGSAATIRKEIRDVEIKLQELGGTTITAPRDGTVFRLNVNERGDAVKEGDTLLTIVPETKQKAVELFVNGNDLPLVKVGQEVRLQFEGWPAVQVAGWPSLAIGVFNGQVATVDQTDNGKGEFRILVTPDETEQKWPTDSNRFLRQGVRTNGWVVLGQVSLGYEFWRQLNGFPVMTSTEASKEKLTKPLKVPK